MMHHDYCPRGANSLQDGHGTDCIKGSTTGVADHNGGFWFR